MTVSFEYEGKIIANAELSTIPFDTKLVIWGKRYAINNVRHEVEIGLKKTGTKKVVEKVICEVEEVTEC